MAKKKVAAKALKISEWRTYEGIAWKAQKILRKKMFGPSIFSPPKIRFPQPLWDTAKNCPPSTTLKNFAPPPPHKQTALLPVKNDSSLNEFA